MPNQQAEIFLPQVGQALPNLLLKRKPIELLHSLCFDLFLSAQHDIHDLLYRKRLQQVIKRA
ncbi:hypothetical protein D3C78_1621900 [compost metagenome]